MASWVLFNSGLPNIVVNDMSIYYPTNKLRAATFARGVWESNLYSNRSGHYLFNSWNITIKK